MSQDIPNTDLIDECSRAIRQKTQEDNYYSAKEWAFIMEWQLRLVENNERDAITDERISLVEKLSWALFDAVYSDAYRPVDDLIGVESLASDVKEQSRHW